MIDLRNPETTTVIIKDYRGNAIGIASFIFGLISIFFLAPIFVPLALLTGIIAILNRQIAWGAIGLICAIIGFLTSPILLGMLGLVTLFSNLPHHADSLLPKSYSQAQNLFVNPVNPKVSGFAKCLLAVAQDNQVPAAVLVGMMRVQGGLVGEQRGPLPDGSFLYGPMLVNSEMVPQLALKWNVSEDAARIALRDDPCKNLDAAAWKLHQKIEETHHLGSAIAVYHSPDPEQGINYAMTVIETMKKFGLVKQKDETTQPVSERINQANKEALESIIECRNRRLNGELKTFVESVNCSNQEFINAYQRADCPYMDLIKLIAAKRLEDAGKIDAKIMTESEGQMDIANFLKQIDYLENQGNSQGYSAVVQHP